MSTTAHAAPADALDGSAAVDHRRALLVSAAIWGAAAVYTLARSWLLGRWLGLDGSFLPTLGAELRALLAWALVTPLVVASARRFPLGRGTWPRSLAVHLAGAAAFTYLLQIVVDSPRTLSGEWGVGTAMRNAGIAFLDNFHLAGLVRATLPLNVQLLQSTRNGLTRESARFRAAIDSMLSRVPPIDGMSRIRAPFGSPSISRSAAF